MITIWARTGHFVRNLPTFGQALLNKIIAMATPLAVVDWLSNYALPAESKKVYTFKSMSRNTASIATVQKIQLGLDRWDFKLDYDTIKVELLTHKPAASFWKSTKNRVSNPVKSFTM